MKTIVFSIITFILGAVIAATVTYSILSANSVQVVATITTGQASALSIYGTLLSQKRYSDLQDVIESGLHQTLIFQKELDLPASQYLASKKFIRGYFDASQRPLPPAIEEHISDVPSGQGTDMKVLSDFAVTHAPN